MRWEIPAQPSPSEVRLAAKLKRGSKFFAFLWEIRGRLFSPEFQDELIAGFERNRADNVPPALLAMVWLLRRTPRTATEMQSTTPSMTHGGS